MNIEAGRAHRKFFRIPNWEKIGNISQLWEKDGTKYSCLGKGLGFFVIKSPAWD